MPRISRFYGMDIVVWHRDHNPPHFHVRYAGREAQIRIQSFAVLNGALPATALDLVREWSEMHQEELLENWRLARERKPLNQIEPLR
jgi:hypothetical protein